MLYELIHEYLGRVLWRHGASELTVHAVLEAGDHHDVELVCNLEKYNKNVSHVPADCA